MCTRYSLFLVTDPIVLMNCDSAAEDLVSCLQVLEVTCPAVHCSLLPQVIVSKHGNLTFNIVFLLLYLSV